MNTVRSGQGRKRSVSIVDVARVAGVSHQTVSRVLNDPGSVRPKTLQAVRAAIRETGYHRNENARALKSSVSNGIGVLASDSQQFGPGQLLWNVEKAAGEQGYLAKISLLKNNNDNDVQRAVGKLLEYDVSAIIVLSTETWIEPVVRMAADLPLVSIGSSSAQEGQFSVVDTDQQQGVRTLLDHLVAQGARRIDHLSGPHGWYSSEARLEEWMQASSRYALTAGRVYRGDWSEESGYRVGLDMADDLPDAVFSANDQMAIGLIRAFCDRGLRVPDDVMVAGFDGVPMGAYTIPSLTTVQQDFDALSSRAVSRAIDMIHGASVKKLLMQPRLIIRESTRR
ncbi:LacI family transcriptional regulator [Bifidobacterium asteroides]|nr:LacI family transcriptional regulator [Bifidobacterium asteroides]